MAATSPRVPKFRRHKTGQGFVEIGGKRHYLGRYDLPETQAKYHRLVAEMKVNGGQLPIDASATPITIVEMIARFWAYHATKGRDELANYRHALRPLLDLYGDTLANDFSPLKLEVVRQHMLEHGCGKQIIRGNCTRNYVNRNVIRIRSVFRWAGKRELLDRSVYHHLKDLDGLKLGEARDNDPVEPVPLALVDPLRSHVSRQVWAMIQVQLLTCARPGEVVIMRPCDIDKTADKDVWIYRPMRHKTQHHGHKREIYLMKEAQRVVAPFLKGRDAEAFVFSPVDAERERHAKMRESRKTPVQPSQIDRSVDDPERTPGDRYTRNSYRRAITRACAVAFPPPPALAKRDDETRRQWASRLTKEQKAQLKSWRRDHDWHPHQLRHTGATTYREKYGLEFAQVMLGHRTLRMSEHYARLGRDRVFKVARKVG